jgi:hypothetical protein
MLPENAAALVGAGMLSVLVFRLAGFARLGRIPPAPSAADEARGAVTEVTDDAL